jgi:CRISPR-associated endonuclease/helicase Cas3
MGRFKSNNLSIPTINFSKCSAKTTQTGDPGINVFAHCRNVHSVADALIDFLPNPLRDQIRQPALLAAALHDVGKVSPGFQKKYFNKTLLLYNQDLAVLPNSRFEKNHAAIGQSSLNRIFGPGDDHSPIALIAGAHHGSISQKESLSDTAGVFGGEAWAKERRKFINVLIKELNLKFPEKFPDKLWPVIAGLVSTADWIGSDEQFFPPDKEIEDYTSLTARAHKAVKACGWGELTLKHNMSFDQVFGFQPYPTQQAFIEKVTRPGLYILEAPMGMGKTEAALFAAYRLMEAGHHRGLYFGLPTRLTSDKIHDRLTHFLKAICDGPFSLKLAHGNAWMRPFLHGAVNRDEKEGGVWFTPRKRSLLCPFAVGTIDQALLSVLRVKHFFVRSFGLAGKVVILDEVHSYDCYTGTIMDTMIQGLVDWGCTVIILSATLTRERRHELLLSTPQKTLNDDTLADPYPLISWKQAESPSDNFATAQPPSQKYHLHICDWESQQVASEASKRAREGQCVLCIANTVAQAQFWYDALAAERAENEFELGLMHARFPAFARDVLETKWIAKLGKTGPRPKGCVLVATQVVEQSVDIDADALITELCPTDMLLQRMGRQWRHQRKSRPCRRAETFIVTKPVDEASSSDDILNALGHTNCLVYAPYLLWRSYNVWSKRSSVNLPEDVRCLLEKTYVALKRESSNAAELYGQLREVTGKLKQLACATAATVSSLPVMEDREDVATRYSDLPMVDVLPVVDLKSDGYKAKVELLDGSTHDIEARQKAPYILAKLHANLLAIPRYRLQRIGALSMPTWLDGVFYETTPVLLWDPASGELTFDGRPTGYVYDSKRGLRWSADQKTAGSADSCDWDELSGIDVFDKNQFDW